MESPRASNPATSEIRACSDTFQQDRVHVGRTANHSPIHVELTYAGKTECTLSPYGPTVHFVDPAGSNLGGYGNIYQTGPVIPIPPIHPGDHVAFTITWIYACNATESGQYEMRTWLGADPKPSRDPALLIHLGELTPPACPRTRHFPENLGIGFGHFRITR